MLGYVDRRVLSKRKMTLSVVNIVCVKGILNTGKWCSIQMSGEGEKIEDLRECWILCLTW